MAILKVKDGSQWADIPAIVGPAGPQGPTGAIGPQGPKGETGQTGQTGPAGADGVSPTVAVSSITGGHRVTVTDGSGDHVFDVLDGTTPSVPVTDVQMNGTSILSGGVANISTDASPTENSLNPVQSGGVKTSLDGKVNKAGDTMTGILVAPELRVNAAENTDAAISLRINSANKCTIQYYDQDQKLRLMEWKSSGGDVYSLPSIAGEPTGNRYYDILTSKTFTPSSIGIVENTDTATNTISKGQYVIWKGALYTAKSAIPSGTALSSSNLQAVSNGGLNAVNDRIGIKDVTYTVASTSVGAKSQLYAYVQLQSGYTPISAYFVPDSGISTVFILSNPVVSSSQAVCRIFNPSDAAATVAGTLHVLFAKNAMIES